jgi:hypothetical protein
MRLPGRHRETAHCIITITFKLDSPLDEERIAIRSHHDTLAGSGAWMVYVMNRPPTDAERSRIYHEKVFQLFHRQLRRLSGGWAHGRSRIDVKEITMPLEFWMHTDTKLITLRDPWNHRTKVDISCELASPHYLPSLYMVLLREIVQEDNTLKWYETELQRSYSRLTIPASELEAGDTHATEA